ncbi:hypothetical protein [Nocardia sp. BMG51109]|uniref:hypothetical protein n=1 Tax=Nocardia sp. BMG51109 TaxID=1056816 RepID=UPI0012EB67BB|nr:hypothetical protein [Nocardia sp. BMG51109]
MAAISEGTATGNLTIDKKAWLLGGAHEDTPFLRVSGTVQGFGGSQGYLEVSGYSMFNQAHAEVPCSENNATPKEFDYLSIPFDGKVYRWSIILDVGDGSWQVAETHGEDWVTTIQASFRDAEEEIEVTEAECVVQMERDQSVKSKNDISRNTCNCELFPV